MTKAEAYRHFTSRTLKIDESPDAYVADVQRLAALSGHDLTDDKGPMMVEQLIAGLPFNFTQDGRMVTAGKEHCVSI